MTPGKFLYEGKAKKLYETDDPEVLLLDFTDNLTAFNAEKKGNESGKGSLNCTISARIFELLESHGIPTHYLKTIDDHQMLCKKMRIIPIEVVVRNIATGSLTKRLGIPDGTELDFTLVEFCWKNDDYGDPIINDEHAVLMKLVDDPKELDILKEQARKINTVLRQFFDERGLILVDFKLEFGKDAEGTILLADEISPDSCRFWDKESREKLDKDRFRQGLGGVKMAYEEVLKRILNEGEEA